MRTTVPGFAHGRSGVKLRRAVTAGAVAAAIVAGAALASPAAEAAPQPGPATEAGMVFANETLAGSQLPAAAGAGQRYSYWTRGASGQLHAALATMVEPKGAAPAGGWPVVVHAPAGYGLAEACSASADPTAGARDTVNRLLRSGYAVITPDYGVPGKSGGPQYTDHTVTARNLLDAVLAGVVVDGSVAPRWSVVGDEQGAGAAVVLASKAAEWQSGKLDFRGAAATSVPAGVDVLLSGLNPASPAVSDSVTADVAYALATLDVPELASVLSKTGLDLVAKAEKLCAPDLIKAVRGTTLGQLVRKPVADNARLASTINRSLSLPRTGYQRPLLLSQTLQDDSVQLHEALRFLAEAQLGSNQAQAATYLTGDPADAERQEQAAVMKFLDSLF